MRLKYIIFTWLAFLNISHAALDSEAMDSSGSVEELGKLLKDRVNKIAANFHKETGAEATIFVRNSNDEFVRVITSLIRETGESAVGSVLSHDHPGYKGLLNGEDYTGEATLFGIKYMTKYMPVKDSDGNVVAVLFVGKKL